MVRTIFLHPVLRHCGILLLGVLILGTIVLSGIVNPHSIAWLCGVYLVTILLIPALRKARTSTLHRAYALYQVTLSLYLLNVWMLHVSVPGRTPDETMAQVDLWAQILRVGSIYMSVALFHLMLNFTGSRKGFLLAIEYLGWGVMSYFLLCNWAGTFVDGWRWSGTTWVPKLTGNYRAFFYATSTFVTLGLLVPCFKFFAITAKQRRLQIFYYLLGALPLWISCWGNFLISWGLNIYPAGGFIFFAHAAIMAYAVLKHKVFDIVIVIRRGLAYAGVSFVLGCVFGLLVYAGGKLLGNTQSGLKYLPEVAFVLVTGFLLVPLYSYLQSLVDAVFFRKAVNRQKALSHFSTSIASTIDLYQVVSSLGELIQTSLRPSEIKVYLASDSGAQVLYGVDREKFFPVLWPEGEALAPEVTAMVAESRTPQAMHNYAAAPNDKVVSFGQGSDGMAVPIRHQQELLGVIVLGPRQADENYNEDDQEWLELIAANVSLALFNAKSYAAEKYLTELTSLIVERMSAGLITMDDEGNLGRWNSAALSILDFKAGTAASRTLKELWEVQPILASAINRATQAGESISNLELRLEGRKQLWILLGVGSMEGKRKRREHLITLHDISDYKAMESLAQKNAALAQLGQLISSINHEVKNILQPMRYQVGKMARAAQQDTEIKKSVEVVLNRANALDKLLENLKDLSRPIELAKRKIPVGSLIQSAMMDIKELPAAGQMEFSFAVPDDLAWDADGYWIKRVLYNLLRNAVEATAGSALARISVAAHAANAMVELSIEDSGCGISADSMRNLFQPFYSTKGEAGTGLGLSICRRIIELHGGEISVQSEPGKGTTFKMTLPAAQAWANEKSPTS